MVTQSPKPPQPSDTVLVVGAGPTGLTVATLLTLYGVPVRLVEKRAGLSRHTKATNLMQRSLELLDSVDLAEPLQRIGGAMDRLTLSAYGRSFGPISMHLDDTAFPDVVLCGQDAFESAAAQRLLDLGVEIDFGTELVGLIQDAEGCTAQLSRAGQAEFARVAFVVGADGATGATRRFTQLNFHPARTGVAIRQVDCTLRWDRASTGDQMWLFYVNRGFAAVVPLSGGVHRVLLIKPVDAMPQREPTLLELQTRLREAAADPTVELTELRWASYTDLSMGMAPSLIDGRVILAGDASNPVLPNGGQGMNTGIADAFNLSWKLATVLLNQGPVELLASYDKERHALRTRLQKAQHASLKYSVLSTPAISRALIRLLGGPLLALGGARAMARAFSELDITTRDSELSVDTNRRAGVRAGGRAPDAALTQHGRSIRLRRVLYDGAWTLLSFSGRGRRADIAAALAALQAIPGLPGHVITTVPTPPHENDLAVLYDLDGEAHARYGYRRPTLVLVRPDGHVAIRTSPRQVELVTDFMQRWHVTGNLRFTSVRTKSNVPSV